MTEMTTVAQGYDLLGENAEVLREVGRIVLPEIDQVLDDFYIRATADSVAAGFFDNTAHMDKAKAAQKAHWERLFDADFGKAYGASIVRIGNTHARIKLPVNTYMSAYAHATSDLMGVLLRKTRGGLWGTAAKRQSRLAQVMGRAFTMDMAQVLERIIARAEKAEQDTAFEHLNKAIDHLSSGDLTYRIPSSDQSDFPTDYDVVRRKLNAAMVHLSDTMGRVSARVSEMITASRAVGQNTDELARRTENQAASIEQTSAAMQELAQSVATSTEATEQARDVAQSARGDMQSGVAIVRETADAMSRIRGASDKISQIIGLIDDVSFQTNLLSLNAGVEAARAGDAGRGFAVVASEVRSLATSTSEAAQDIKDLILSSAEEVEAGVGLTDKATRTFDDIVTSFDNMSEFSMEIAHASGEQAMTVKEVNQAVAEIDSITQHNAAMALQTMQAMQDMLNGADEVQVLLANLRFDTAGADSASGREIAA